MERVTGNSENARGGVIVRKPCRTKQGGYWPILGFGRKNRPKTSASDINIGRPRGFSADTWPPPTVSTYRLKTRFSADSARTPDRVSERGGQMPVKAPAGSR